MKSTLAILLATTAVIGALGLPTLSAIGRTPGTAADSALTVSNTTDGAMVLASSNDDDSRNASRRDNDDDDESDCHNDDDCRRTAPAPAQTGPVTPPANGLFRPGAAPQVRTN